MSVYEKAIAAYQFQVERYHTWMNYYSLFNGALLIALYSIENPICNDKVSFLFLCISFLGFIAGLCWLGTVIGNRKWIDSWIRIVQEVEKKDSKEIHIYNLFYANGSMRGILSTQKIMQIFAAFVTLAWFCVILMYSIPNESTNYQLYQLGFLSLTIIVFVIAIIMYYCQCHYIYSSTKNMDIKN